MYASYSKRLHNLLSSASLLLLSAQCTCTRPVTFQQGSAPFPLGQVQPGGESLCPLAHECAALSVLPPHLQMSPAPAALFRPFGMTLPYGRSPDKEPPLQLTDFIYWVGRKCLCGASDSSSVPYALPHASKPPSRGADILERTS